MIDSVPLIQNPNNAQQINASIIAMKKASRELNEKIVKLNSLNSELDKKIALLDSGLNKEIEDRKEAINSLDVSSVGGSGKYISAISETDGKISATVSDLTSVIESGNNQPATSGGVADAIQGVISLPTDAVLHYSFDEVPDYPDGTAIEKKDNDFTDSDGWSIETAGLTFSVDNGIAKWTSPSTNYIQLAKATSSGTLAGSIFRFKLKCSVKDISVRAIGVFSDAYPIISQIKSNGNWQELIGYIPSNYNNRLILQAYLGVEGATFEIAQAYIGDGSYSTPIIDNANGQNNATNNGGIAVKGVSGKGAYFLEGKYANIGTDFQLNANFSISLWVKPDNNTLGLNSDIIAKYSQFILRNGATWGNYLMLYLYGKNSILLDSSRIRGGLLTPNVWTNIVITRNELTCKCYIDGMNVKTFTLADNTIRQSTEPFSICRNSSRPQSIDDLLIFDRALTENEVMALYLNKANTPKYYSWADWKLNQMENANRSIVAETRNIEEPPIEESGEEER